MKLLLLLRQIYQEKKTSFSRHQRFNSQQRYKRALNGLTVLGKMLPPRGETVVLTNCMQEVVVVSEGHERVWQLPQPLLHQAGHGVDGIVLQADQVGI